MNLNPFLAILEARESYGKIRRAGQSDFRYLYKTGPHDFAESAPFEHRFQAEIARARMVIALASALAATRHDIDPRHDASPSGIQALETAFRENARRPAGRPSPSEGITAPMTSREREAWQWWRTALLGRKHSQWSDERKARHAAKQARDYAEKKAALGVRPYVEPSAQALAAARQRIAATHPALSPATVETLARYLASPL